jgi:aspartyl-tRNA(Asn)/glutamyl-tRNA(Gln) amidotransferase subunit A
VPDLSGIVAAVPSRRPRLGLVGEPFRDRTDPEMRAQLDGVARTLRDRGAVVEPVELPAIVSALIAASTVVVRVEAAAAHADLYRAHAGEYRPRVRAAIELGMCVPGVLYLRAQRIRREARRELAALLERYDGLLMPPAPGPAPDRSTTGDASLNAPWSAIGVPQVALPSGLTADGLPLGIQLIGAPFAETRLLEAARWVEAVLRFSAAPPG